jgi:hypothetical protein
VNSQLMEVWLRLTADAVKGAEEARKALGALAEAPLSPEGLSRWAAAWLPSGKLGGTAADPGELRALVEEWWKALGVVPRGLFLDLLARYETLRTRLEEAEEAVKNLRELLQAKGQETEAKHALQGWEELTRKALDLQEQWFRTWMESFSPRPSKKV